jgi:hypothetical protein
VLTLASIVEAEAMVDIERPRIATVYLNRLAMGMRLQADPTVGYAIGRGPRTRLLLRHLRVDSPFNTYLYEGLPPGPICNPGRASIAGVIDPLPGIKELYFVADGYGRHLFSRTYEEHLSKIRQVRGGGAVDPAIAPETARSAVRPETSATNKANGRLAAKAGPAATPAPAAVDTAAARKSGSSASRKLAPVSAARADTTAAKKPGASKTGTGASGKKPSAAATAKPTASGTTATAKPTASGTTATAKPAAAGASAKPAASGSTDTAKAATTSKSTTSGKKTTSKSTTSATAKKPAKKGADTTTVAKKKSTGSKTKSTAAKKPATSSSKAVASGTP